MARKNPVPESERAVCRRLREVRKAARLSRVAFAEFIGIPVLRLASYEYGRVPVPYAVARAVCQRFDVSQRWLATGKSPMPGYFAATAAFEAVIKGRMLFSIVYETRLRSEIEQRMDRVDPGMGMPPADASPTQLKFFMWPKLGQTEADFRAEIIGNEARSTLARLPEHLRSEYYDGMLNASHALLEAMAEGRLEKLLDKFRESVNSRSVPVTLTELRERVRAVTTKPGSKGKLAKFLGVPRSRVSEWLANIEPRAEVAFKLLAWVTAEEANQQKSATGVDAPAARKTQTKDRQANENPKSRPHKASPKRNK